MPQQTIEEFESFSLLEYIGVWLLIILFVVVFG